MRRFFSAVLAVAAILVGTGSAQAAPIIVFTDSGNIGEFTFTNTGIVSGTATIAVSVPSLLSTINTVNGLIVAPEPVRVNTPLTLMVTPTTPGEYNLSLPAGVTETIGATVGQQAILGFNLNKGTTPLILTNFFNVSGPVSSVIANNNPNYNFTHFGVEGGRINITFTATSFTGATTFSDLFTTVGATAVGNGSFSQVTIPEPSSFLILGLGLAGTVVGTRFRKQTKVTV